MPVWLKRDDLLHATVSGNKFRKLKYPLLNESAKGPGPRCLVTMGGLWSNHVHASAYAAAACGMTSHAFIRTHPGMNSAMLDDCRAWGMQVTVVDAAAYRRLRADEEYWRTLLPAAATNQRGQFWLPEGGSAPLSLRGVAELVEELGDPLPDTIVLACGTGATLAGLLAGLNGRGRVVAIAVLNQAEHLHGEVARLLRQAGYPPHRNYDLRCEFAHGGYARVSEPLLATCSSFQAATGVAVEPVYTGKAVHALRALAQRAGYFAPGERVLLLHTGGLQGARGSAHLRGAGAGGRTGVIPTCVVTPLS